MVSTAQSSVVAEERLHLALQLRCLYTQGFDHCVFQTQFHAKLVGFFANSGCARQKGPGAGLGRGNGEFVLAKLQERNCVV